MECLGEGSFELAVTSIQRKGREDKETFEVVDNTMVEMAIEVFRRGLVMQGEAAHISMEGLDVQHQSQETLDKVLESIPFRLLKPSAEPLDNMSYKLNLSILKKMIRKEIETPDVQLTRIEEELMEDEDMKYGNEAIREKSGKKGKRKLTKGGVTLDMLQSIMDIFKESKEPRKVDEGRTKLFATHPLSWKLEDS